MVVLNQPQAVPQIVSVQNRRATTFVGLTAVLMVLCALHFNLPAFVCLVPALICACVVSTTVAGRPCVERQCISCVATVIGVGILWLHV